MGRKGYGKSTLTSHLCKDYERVIVIDTLNEYKNLVEVNIGDLNYFMKNEKFRIKIVPSNADHFDNIILELCDYENYLLVVDEVGFWQDSAGIPESFLNLVRFGRHKKIDMLFVSRRPSEFNRMVTSQGDEFYLFNTREPRDLEYLSKYVSDSVAEKVKDLEPFTFLVYKIPDKLYSGTVTPGKIEINPKEIKIL